MYDYNCPDCNEAKLQSDKNARKINEIIGQVNKIVDNDIISFIQWSISTFDIVLAISSKE